MAEADEETDLAENLSLQLCEVEMLRSMFPKEQEFCLDDTVSLVDIQNFIDGKLNKEFLNTRIGFTLNIHVREDQDLEVICQLPHEYPSVPPTIFMRAHTLTRSLHSKLTEQLLNYIDELQRGELYIGNVIQWLQDHAGEYVKMSHNSQDVTVSKRSKSHPRTFSRMWIYSHHLYSKIKRKDILFLSGELDLSGFSMPGKPGIIAIEGLNNNVEDFWGRIRRMQWKRIVMKEKEDFDLAEGVSVDSLRKFDGFSERFFEPRQNKGRAHHGDRGLLYQFLEEKGLAHVFQYFFGVEGRPTEPDSD